MEEKVYTWMQKEKIALAWWRSLPITYRKMLCEEILEIPYTDDIIVCEVVEIAEKIHIFYV